MLTPDYLMHVSEGAEAIAAQLHTDIINRIVERILIREKRGDEYILTAVDKWHIETLIDAGYLRDDLVKEISNATAYEEKEIQEAFEDAGVEAIEYDNRIYERAGLTPSPMSPDMVRMMQRNYEATLGEWKNFTRTTADEGQTTFINAMDDLYNQVASGSLGYTQAFVEAIDRLASGDTYIYYPTGHRDTVETAALRCVRTGISQMSAEIQISRMDEMGVDLVLVSSHMGARPSHQVWQGKVYSRSGKDPKYPDFVSSTGYGTGPGLCGWNCRHNFSPYFEGMENPFERYDDEKNKELYEKTQEQRSMERSIRKTKRKVQVLENAANTAQDEDIAGELRERAREARKQLKEQNAAYQDFCEKNDFRPLPERLKIAQANRRTRPVSVKPKVPDKTEPAKAETFTDKMQTIRNRVKKNGAATEADIHEAGKLVKQEMTKSSAEKDAIREEISGLIEKRSDFDLKIQELSDQIQEIIDSNTSPQAEFDPFSLLELLGDNPEIDALQKQIDALMENGEYRQLCKRIEDLKAKVQSTAHNNANTLKNILSRFREMGHDAYKLGVKTKTATADVLREALSFYPKEWVQYAIDSGGITVRKVSRGYCNPSQNLIALSGYGDDDTFTTAMHELGHYFERKVSISNEYIPYDSAKHWYPRYMKEYYPEGQTYILDAERAFYKKRTDGERLEWLGPGYKRTEVTRKDDFIHKYMGKDYGGGDFELVSMGFQYAYTDPETLAKDPEMEEWIYGLLSLF